MTIMVAEAVAIAAIAATIVVQVVKIIVAVVAKVTVNQLVNTTQFLHYLILVMVRAKDIAITAVVELVCQLVIAGLPKP